MAWLLRSTLLRVTILCAALYAADRSSAAPTVDLRSLPAALPSAQMLRSTLDKVTRALDEASRR